MKRIVIALCLIALVTGCQSKKREDLKSPCVGAAGSPCEKRNVNDWWLS